MVNFYSSENLKHYDVEILYYVELFPQLLLKNDIIYIKLQDQTTFDKIFGQQIKIIVPDSLKNEIIASAHASKQSGHFKFPSTYSRVFSKYHWRQMKSDITNYINKCLLCNISSDKPNLRNQQYTNLECSILNQCVHINISGNVPWNISEEIR